MKSVLSAVSAAIFVIFFGASAQATCPYTFDTSGITNGQTADATPVANNFNYLITCPTFTGSVGIGTPATTTPLAIVPPSDIASIFVNNDGTQGHMGAIMFNSGYSQKWTVGAGDTIGAARNFIISESSGGDYFPQYVFNSGAGSANAALDMLNDAGTSSIRLSTYQDSYLVSSGNFGVGTATPSLKLFVQGTAGGTSAWSNTSDARLKKNIAPIADALALVEQMQGVRFAWRKPEERSVARSLKLPLDEPQVGFIAQDLRKVLPEAVAVSGDNERLLSVSESKVVPVLVEAVKKLAAMNESQVAEIHKLQGRVSALERRSERRTAENPQASIH